MPEEPICPNDELERLASIIMESPNWPDRIGAHTLRKIGVILPLAQGTSGAPCIA